MNVAVEDFLAFEHVARKMVALEKMSVHFRHPLCVDSMKEMSGFIRNLL